MRRILFPSSSLVDGGGLRTFFCDLMHRLRSSGYTLSGIYIDDLRRQDTVDFWILIFSGKFQPGDQFFH